MNDTVHAKYLKLLDYCKALPPTRTAVAHPCDESSLRGAIDAARLDPSALGMRPSNQRYEQIGEVPAWAHDLDRRWAEEEERTRVIVSPDEAVLALDVPVRVPPQVAWEFLTRPGQRMSWQPWVTDVTIKGDEGGRRGLGSANHCMHGEDAVIEGFRSMAATVCVGVRAMMDRAVAENSSLIIDGVSLVPGLIDLASYQDRAHVIFLIVATLEPEAFRSRFAARAREAVERPPHRYVENLEAILRIQDYLLELAEQHGVPIVDNVSFDRSVTSIIRHVTETLRKQGDFDAAALL